MASINNSKIMERIIREAKIQLSVDAVPTQLAEKIVPVLVSNPLQQIDTTYTKISSTSTSTSTIIVLDTKKQFYCTGASLSSTKDATCDLATGTQCYIKILHEGKTLQFLNLSQLTLTAQDQNLAIVFPEPIKVDKGSAIILVLGTHTAGLWVKSGSVYGFTMEE